MMPEEKIVAKEIALKKKMALKKKVKQMQELRENTTRSSSGSIKWTTGDEIRFLTELPELIARRREDRASPLLHRDPMVRQRLLEYRATMKNRKKWEGIDPEAVKVKLKELLAG